MEADRDRVPPHVLRAASPLEVGPPGEEIAWREASLDSLFTMLAAIVLSLLTFIYSPLVKCDLYTDPSLLPQSQYDFVIVGAGTAGNVLANRLTENTTFSVLVIEAGVSNTADFVDQVPFLDLTLAPDTIVTWNYTTTPQEGLNNRAVPYPRGRVLGGSSTINLLVWTRGSVDDFDRYANVTGDSGWSWDELLPYMKKSEQLVPPSDHKDTTGEVDPSVHGTDGPIQISLAGYPNAIDDRVIEMTEEIPPPFLYNEDMNSGYPLGLGWAQHAITTSGRRSSSATGYLEPVLSRSTLDVLIQTQVTKLIGTNATDGTVAFTQVEMAQNSSSERFIVSAAKEVILSAGSVGTPQILQLSGIGDAEYLQSVGVTPLVNLSDVGQNLIDHPMLTNHWLVNSNCTYDEVSRNATLADQLLAQWNSTGTGLFVDDAVNHIAWSRLSSDSPIFDNYSDPSAGPASPHLEFIPSNGWASWVQTLPATGNYLTVLTIVVSPASRGSVLLASNDPFDSPLIDPGFFTNPFDIYAMVEAVKTVQSFLQGSAWDGYIQAAAPELANATTDAELAAYVRNYSDSIWHPVGTARMASNTSDEGVVTPDLLVKGTSGLRVVDASVLPYIPSGHTQAGVYAVAERAADLIKAAWMGV